jgi:hypothetical protein
MPSWPPPPDTRGKPAATPIGPPRRDDRQRRRSSPGPATITQDAPVPGSLTNTAQAPTPLRAAASWSRAPRPTAAITAASRSTCSARYGPTRTATPAGYRKEQPSLPPAVTPSLTPAGPYSLPAARARVGVHWPPENAATRCHRLLAGIGNDFADLAAETSGRYGTALPWLACPPVARRAFCSCSTGNWARAYAGLAITAGWADRMRPGTARAGPTAAGPGSGPPARAATACCPRSS